MMNWKECGRKRSWPTFRRCAEILSAVTEMNDEKLRIVGVLAEI
jgi:hypothetical protein